MREITSHHAEGHPDLCRRVYATDLPAYGGAHHAYEITLRFPGHDAGRKVRIEFQKGPITAQGVNGLTHETLLAILIDRLEHFQKGDLPCPENAEALRGLRKALTALHKRIQDRVSREVEGTPQP